MRYLLFIGFWVLVLLGCTVVAVKAQAPAVSYFVTSAAPSSNNTPSVLRKLVGSGAFSTVGTVNEAGTGLVLNALGYNSSDLANIFGMGINGSGPTAPPIFYRVSLATAAATALGTLTPPPAPAVAFPNVGLSYIIPQLGDGAPGSTFYLAAATLRYNLFTGIISDVRFFVGAINLNVAPFTIPVWRQADISNPAAAAVINNMVTQTQAYAAGGPLPAGGIQDWVFDPATGNLLSSLGIEQQFLTVSNPGTAPVAVVTTPAVPLPVSTELGYMFRDGRNELYAMSADGGLIYHLNRTTGSYLGTFSDSGLGSTRGDASTAPGAAAPLPVFLTRFAAAPAGPARVALTWATASEDKAAGFDVQRRAANGPEWATLATVPATNAPAGSRYAYTDAAARPGTNYYRLVLRDLDGATAFSAVQVALVGKAETASLLAYPNPCLDRRFVLPLPATATPEAAHVALLDNLGRTVWTTDAPVGQALLEATLPAALPAGHYTLRCAGHSQSLLVQ